MAGSLTFCFFVLEIVLRVLYGTHLIYDIDEETYWQPMPSQFGFPSLGLPRATVNSRGFRGPEPEAGKRNVLMLGDSYTFGVGVADDDTLPAQLQRELDRREAGRQVLNMGVPGWGLFQEEVRLRRVFDRYKPDVVILTLVLNDLLRLPFEDAETRDSYLRRARIRSVLSRSTALCFLKERLGGILQSNFGATENYRQAEGVDKLWEQNAQYLEGIRTFLETKGARFILVAYPSPMDGFEEKVVDYCRAQGTEHLSSPRAAFEGYGRDELTIPGDGHPSALAYRLLIGMMADAVVGDGGRNAGGRDGVPPGRGTRP